MIVLIISIISVGIFCVGLALFDGCNPPKKTLAEKKRRMGSWHC